MTKKPDRIVLDTNLFISFLINDSLSPLDYPLFSGSIRLLFSKELIAEFFDVAARPKFKRYFPNKKITALFEELGPFVELIDVQTRVNSCRDVKDNFLLELCVDGKADFLVTGDKDLLLSKRFGETVILTLTEYLSHLNQKS